MELFVLNTKLHSPASAEAYEAAHRNMGREVRKALQEAGFASWRIFRNQEDLVHLIECSDYHICMDEFKAHPVGKAWMEAMSKLLWYKAEDPMKMIWTL